MEQAIKTGDQSSIEQALLKAKDVELKLDSDTKDEKLNPVIIKAEEAIAELEKKKEAEVCFYSSDSFTTVVFT